MGLLFGFSSVTTQATILEKLCFFSKSMFCCLEVSRLSFTPHCLYRQLHKLKSHDWIKQIHWRCRWSEHKGQDNSAKRLSNARMNSRLSRWDGSSEEQGAVVVSLALLGSSFFMSSGRSGLVAVASLSGSSFSVLPFSFP